MPITGPQARAARALVQWPRDHVARLSGIGEAALAEFEGGRDRLPDDAIKDLKTALESGGAVFFGEDAQGGRGVRLKFTRGDVRAINKWEGEGGEVADDDV